VRRGGVPHRDHDHRLAGRGRHPGRINALYQSLMKVTLFASALAVPCWSACPAAPDHRVRRPMQVDGTRPVMLGAGILARWPA